MVLYDEDEVRYKSERNRKIKKYITVGMITSIILIILLMVIIFLLIRNPNKITVTLDGKENQKIESILITKVSQADDSTILYAPIRELASILGYESYRGDYIADVESDDSCYILSKREIVIFKENSNEIYKIDRERQSSADTDYEYVKLKNPVIKENNNLYIDTDGIAKAFNMSLTDYNTKTKTIKMTTLDSLVNSAKTVVNNINYKELDKNLINQRALLDNMIIAKANNNAYGVIGFTGTNSGKEILGAQYDEITYVPQRKVFIAKRNDKVGIVGNDGTTRVSLQYDGLTLIDEDNDLYLAKKDNKYGVIDINENTVIYLEYSRIGVDITSFTKNGLKNGHILLNKVIPVEQNGKWGFFVIQNETSADGSSRVVGRQITNIEFDQIGCRTKSQKAVVASIMVMDDYGLIVVGKNGYYGFMDVDGAPVIPLRLSDLYMETSGGVTSYYMVVNNQTINIIDFFREHGITKK